MWSTFHCILQWTERSFQAFWKIFEQWTDISGRTTMETNPLIYDSNIFCFENSSNDVYSGAMHRQCHPSFGQEVGNKSRSVPLQNVRLVNARNTVTPYAIAHKSMYIYICI